MKIFYNTEYKQHVAAQLQYHMIGRKDTDGQRRVALMAAVRDCESFYGRLIADYAIAMDENPLMHQIPPQWVEAFKFAKSAANHLTY